MSKEEVLLHLQQAEKAVRELRGAAKARALNQIGVAKEGIKLLREPEGAPPPPPPEEEVKPPPPKEEAPSGFAPTWIGKAKGDYGVVQPQDGSIVFNPDGTITMNTGDNTGTSITGNPRDELISPHQHGFGWKGCVGFAVRFRPGSKDALALFSGGSAFCLCFQFFGDPHSGSPPLNLQVADHGANIGHQGNSHMNYNWIWKRPMPPLGSWISVVQEISLGKAVNETAPLRTWLNGEKVFDGPYAVLDDSSRNGTMTARIQQYRKKGVYGGVIPFDFKPLCEGPTKDSVLYPHG